MGSLFLARHSITDASESGRNLGQRSDPPLTRAGERLAERLGAALVAELRELPHDRLRLVSSPALRCRQTASAIARSLAVEHAHIAIEPALLEIDYGGWEGLTGAECMARDPEMRTAWEADPWSTPCPGGESGSDVAARAFPVLARLTRWLAAGRSRLAVVVAHNHVNRLWLCRQLGLPMAEYRVRIAQDPAAYSLLTFGAPGSIVRRVNADPRAIAGP
jgi:broad specificity phosphatase PhoE